MHRPRPTLLRSICALSLLCLLIGACRTDGPDTTSNPADTDTALADGTSGDTSAVSDSVDRRNPPPAPAPGTARVRAQVVACDAAAIPVRCQVRVMEVLGYGSATPPLSTGERTVTLAPSLVDERDVAVLDTLGTRTFVFKHAGERLKRGDEPEDEKSPEWAIQSIE